MDDGSLPRPTEPTTAAPDPSLGSLGVEFNQAFCLSSRIDTRPTGEKHSLLTFHMEAVMRG